MTHWYGWIALAYALLEVVLSGARMAVRAWHGAATGRGLRADWSPVIVAMWVTIAIALVAS